MTRELPKLGQQYKHFKGGIYTILKVTHGYAYHHDDGDKARYPSAHHYCQFDFVACSEIKPGDTVVFYAGSSGTIWARNLYNFQEALGYPSDTSAKASNYYRFEKV